MNKINILITGAGSAVGQGIAKSLLLSKLNIKIIFADINKDNAGFYFKKNSIIIPDLKKNNSLKKMIEIINKYKINVIFVGSELDLLFFSKNKNIIEKKTRAIVNVSPLNTIIMANDKFKTYEFFKKNNLTFVETFLVKNFNEAKAIARNIKFPFYIKESIGTSSRNVFKIYNILDLNYRFFTLTKPIIQKIAGDINKEFTATVFKNAEGIILNPFIARRKLKDGHSWITYVENYKNLANQVINIANKINFVGSLNIQFQLLKKKIIPFEVNARISGTVAIRSFFNFNDPEMFILSFFLKKKISNKIIKKGVCYRYYNELFVRKTKSKNFFQQKGRICNWV
jgi:carbamoyl-phosphate synthase large subunit